MSNDFLHIFIPTRGRPDNLLTALASIEETARDKNRLRVSLYIDEDDKVSRKAVESIPRNRFGFSVTPHVGERTFSQGEMVNILWKHCDKNGGIFGTFVDDYRFVTKDWDDVIREAFHANPDGVLLAFPYDPTAAEHQATLSFLGSKWLDTLGRFLTNYFPFWFDDVWLDEVAQMIGRKCRVEMRVAPQGGKGKTPRMRNLLFWYKFFINTVDERIMDASLLRDKMFLPGSEEYKTNEREGLKVSLRLIGIQKEVTEKQLNRSERELSDPGGFHDEESKIRYLLCEARAISHLLLKARKYNAEGNEPRVIDIYDTVKHSSIHSAITEQGRPVRHGRTLMKYFDRFLKI